LNATSLQSNGINKLKYDQVSKRVPAYYNRPGPGQYENNHNLTKLSKFESSPSIKISSVTSSFGGKIGA